jgi:excinuclease UvrABC nuclease subunit
MKLLKVFGSVARIAEATPNMLVQEAGIPYGVAQEIASVLQKKEKS